MLIDWFTVVAQLVNFLILVWLLKRFLYKPILRAIDERGKGIAAQLAEAGTKKSEAEKEHDEFQHKSQAFDQERAGLLAKAVEEAKAERQRLLDEARKDADDLRDKRAAALQTDRQNLSQEISIWAGKQVFAIARKTLVDLAGASLEQRMVDVFSQRLQALTGTAKDQLSSALKTSGQPVLVRSAFELSTEQRASLRTAINVTFSAEIPLQFQTAPEVVSGIELTANGQKLAWSIADSLAAMETSASELLLKPTTSGEKPTKDTKGKAGTTASPKPAPVGDLAASAAKAVH